MKRWRRRCRGAISIFLVIILIATYLFTGVLVDGARYRMAQALAESALDSASASVLSYYDQLLYDLYGIFGTDAGSEAEITALLEDYVSKTLGAAEIDAASAKALTGAIIGSLTGEGEAEGRSFDGYDFRLAVTGGSGGTLADTDYVEDQLVEQMKYRAPLAIADSLGGEDGFLHKVQGLFDVADRIQTAKEKMELTSGKEGLFREAEALTQQIDILARDVLAYSTDPVKHLGGWTGIAGSWKDPRDYTNAFDTVLAKAAKTYSEGIKALDEAEEESEDTETDSEPEAPPSREELEAALKQAMKQSCGQAVTDLVKTYQTIDDQADELYQRANDLRDQIEALVARYESYIAQLQAKVDAKPNDENTKTCYLPEIEQAKSYCGEMLKNLDIILNSRQDCLDIAAAALPAAMKTAAEQTVKDLLEGPEDDAIRLNRRLTARAPGYSSAASALEDTHAALNGLNTKGSSHRPVHKTDVDVEVNADQAMESVEREKPTSTALRSLKEEDLAVPFGTAGGNVGFNLDGKVDENSITNTMDAGLNLIKTLGKLLEGARDSLYITEYTVMYFPNYVESFGIEEEISWKLHKDLNTGAYKPYNASQGELEYILNGQADAGARMLDIRGRLMAIRTVLNLAAIFTDSAKIQQANVMAAPAGPFAPLVAAGLLVAWALLESVIDVENLLEGKEVFLFKQGAQWQLSLGNLFKEAVGKAADGLLGAAADTLINKVNTFAGKAEQAANQAIYEAYRTAESAGVTQGVNQAGELMRSWSGNLSRELDRLPKDSAEEGSAAAELKQLGRELSNSFETVGQAGDLLTNISNPERAVLKVSEIVQKYEKQFSDRLHGAASAAAQKVASAVSGCISDNIPVGQVVNTGTNLSDADAAAGVKLNYLDYMRLFLLLTGNETKTQRVQQLVQANLRYGGRDGFAMAESQASIDAQLECSVKYLFLSQAVVPESMRQDGRLTFTVFSSLSY